MHNFWYANPKIDFGIVTSTGWVGVDLFFAISGYLISNQLFRYAVHCDKIPIAVFFARRIFRTFPSYIFVIIMCSVFAIFRDGNSFPTLLKLLTFSTNIDLKTGTSLAYTWSLCVEEQFYLAFPIVTAIVLVYLKSRKLCFGGFL